MSRAGLGFEVLGVLLVAASAGVGLTKVVDLWLGLLAAGVVVLAAAWRMDHLPEPGDESPTEDGESGAAMERPAAPRR